MSNFTPGPWVVGISTDHGIACVDTGYTIPSSGYPIEICECWGEECDTETTEMSKANAALISAAPDMYHALEVALSVLVEDSPDEAACDIIRNALDKANGATK